MKYKWLVWGFLCVFAVSRLWTGTERQTTAIPVSRVFAAHTAAPSAVGVYRTRREEQRSAEIAALTVLAETEERAAAYLQELIIRSETELAVESVLASQGMTAAVCVLQGENMTVCVSERLDKEAAQHLILLCAKTAGIDVQKVFLLDENGYL